MNAFFEKFAVVVIMILLIVITWSVVVKPVLIDQRNLQVISQVLNRQDITLKTFQQDISILKGKVFVEEKK